MKSTSNKKPQVIEPLGNGAYYYNYNIEEKQETDPETKKETTVYYYDSVKVWDEPTYKKLVKAVIRETLNETEEFSIINDYNAGVLGVITDKDTVERNTASYKEYLNFVVEVKQQVKEDLQKAGY